MAVRVKRISDDILFQFTCEQWAMMSKDSKDEWTVTENTCGIQTTVGNPYAASEYLFTLNGIVAANYPVVIEVVDGVYTISVVLPEWRVFKGTISSNKLVVTGFTLPEDGYQSYAIVRRQHYHFTDDYTINTGDNSVNFPAGLNLNGQIAYVYAYV